MLSRICTILACMPIENWWMKGRPLAVGDVDGPDLAICERLDGGIERLRNAEASGEEVHGSGGQDRQHLVLAHQRCRSGRDRSVASADQHDVGATGGGLGKGGFDPWA